MLAMALGLRIRPVEQSATRRTTEYGSLTRLLENERLITTLPAAKELRPIVERLITLSKNPSKHAEDSVRRELNDDETLVRKLLDTLGPRFATQPGGYTRIVRIGPRREDAAEMAILELVEGEVAVQRARPKPTRVGHKEAAAAIPVAIAVEKVREDQFRRRLRKKMGERVWVLDNTVSRPFQVVAHFPRLFFGEDLAPSIVSGKAIIEYEVTEFFRGLPKRLTDIVALGLHPSGAVKGITVHLRRTRSRLLLQIINPLALLDPLASLRSVPRHGLEVRVQMICLRR